MGEVFPPVRLGIVKRYQKDGDTFQMTYYDDNEISH